MLIIFNIHLMPVPVIVCMQFRHAFMVPVSMGVFHVSMAVFHGSVGVFTRFMGISPMYVGVFPMLMGILHAFHMLLLHRVHVIHHGEYLHMAGIQ